MYILSVLLIQEALCGRKMDSVESECCYVHSQSIKWQKYKSQSALDGMCKSGYHLPPDASSYDAELAADCLNGYQKRRIANAANGYFLLTEATMNNCFYKPKECKKYIMVCIKDG